jgi:hypothetical protein
MTTLYLLRLWEPSNSRLSASQVKNILRPTFSRPVCLGVKPYLGPKNRFLLLTDSCRFFDAGRPLWPEDWSVVYNCCWPSPPQSSLPRSKSEAHVIYLYNFTCRDPAESDVKSPVPCGHLLFKVLYVTLIYICTIYTKLGITDHALTHAGHVTTAV